MVNGRTRTALVSQMLGGIEEGQKEMYHTRNGDRRSIRVHCRCRSPSALGDRTIDTQWCKPSQQSNKWAPPCRSTIGNGMDRAVIWRCKSSAGMVGCRVSRVEVRDAVAENVGKRRNDVASSIRLILEVLVFWLQFLVWDWRLDCFGHRPRSRFPSDGKVGQRMKHVGSP